MQIDKTFKIKEKYFNAILRLKKPFELRHKEVAPNSIVKLECKNGRYLIFKCKHSLLLNRFDSGFDITYFSALSKYTSYDRNGGYLFYSDKAYLKLANSYVCKNETALLDFDWYDNFCWEYINKGPTYLIEIAEILEVK